MINKIFIKAPAKINIGLNVVSKRDDGYHNIETLFYPIKDLYDELTIEKTDRTSFTCNIQSVPIDETNLVVKAKKLLETKTEKIFPVSINLKKNIPIGAGLGGGSSDAAATLLALNDMFNLKLNYLELVNLGLELGSDVPLFIKTLPAIGKGRGELLDFVELNLRRYILLVNPGIHISTREAYSNISSQTACYDFKKMLPELVVAPFNVKNILKNDFENYAFKKYPDIKRIKELLYDCGAELSMMTGSGSTVFGIFESLDKAETAQKHLPENYFKFLSKPEDFY